MTWYDNAVVFGPVMDGLWTKHRPPIDGRPDGSTSSLLELSGLTSGTLTQMTAIHEAGHAVIGLQHRQQLTEVAIDDTTYPGAAGYALWQSELADVRDYGIMTAAGEQASLRWLRESSLYTPASGWAAEVLSLPDRRELTGRVADVGHVITFGRRCGPTELDWNTFALAADDALAHSWMQVTAVAVHLQDRGRLTGHEVAAIMTAAGSDT